MTRWREGDWYSLITDGGRVFIGRVKDVDRIGLNLTVLIDGRCGGDYKCVYEYDTYQTFDQRQMLCRITDDEAALIFLVAEPLPD